MYLMDEGVKVTTRKLGSLQRCKQLWVLWLAISYILTRFSGKLG
jgi:hypothetical protein